MSMRPQLCDPYIASSAGAKWASDPLTRDIVARLRCSGAAPRPAPVNPTEQDREAAAGDAQDLDEDSCIELQEHREEDIDGLGDDGNADFDVSPEDSQSAHSATVTTKDLLRPVFRWMKMRNQHYDPGKAFEFAHWVAVLSTKGDASLGVPQQPQIQPVYIFNTLVTMAQRNRSEAQARRAHRAMLELGFTPDIFAYTALMSVVGQRDANEAYSIYVEMLSSAATRPNVVTVVTIIRSTMKKVPKEVGIPRIMSILHDASTLALAAIPRSNEGAAPVDASAEGASLSLDASIFVAALSAAVHYLDLKMLVDVLHLLRKSLDFSGNLSGSLRKDVNGSESVVRYSELTYEIIGKFVAATRSETERRDEKEYQNILDHLSSLGLVDDVDIASIEAHIVMRKERLQAAQVCTDAILIDSYKLPGGSGHDASVNYAKGLDGGDCRSKISARTAKCPFVDPMGCLGQSTPLPLRASVIAHDLNRLASRLVTRNEALSEEDFATLIHQCRKRKWPEQVPAILEFIDALSTVGIPDLNLSPQPNLHATATTYDAAFESYFAVSRVDDAWELFIRIFGVNGGTPRVDNYVLLKCFTERMQELVLSGFIRCGAAEKAIDAFLRFRDLSGRSLADHGSLPPFRPSSDLLLGFMRGMGARQSNVASAIQILEDLVRLDGGDAARLSLADCKNLINTLLRSCALLGLGDALPSIFQSLTSSSEPAIRLPALELLSSLNVDYVMTILMASVAFTSDPQESMRYLLTMQAEHRLLPPTLVFHSVAIEAQAQAWSKSPQTQLMATLGLGTLPFRSFMLVGAVKHVSLMHEFLSTCLRHFRDVTYFMMNSSCEFDWVKYPSLNNAYLCSFDVLREIVAQLFTVVGVNSEEIHETDGVLINYMTIISSPALNSVSSDSSSINDRDSGAKVPANRDIDPAFIASLCMQHVFGRFVAVKTRGAKDALSSQLNHALSKLGSTRALWMFACNCIRLMSSIYCASDRSFPRFIQFLFQAFATCDKLLDEANGEVDNNTIISIIGAFADGRVGLDVFKIVNKLVQLTRNRTTRQLVANFIVSTLGWDSENPLTVIRTLREFEFCDYIDIELLEEHLVERCRDKPSKAIHEYIVSFFPTDGEGRWFAAVRIAKRILNWNEPTWQDFVSSLLFKFHEPAAMATVTADVEAILRSNNREPSSMLCADVQNDDSVYLENGELYGINLYERLIVTYVDNDAAVDEARAYMAAAADARRSSADEIYTVGVDAEWRPDRLNAGGEGKSMCALLQLADAERVFIFDLIALDSGIEQFLHYFLSSKRIMKLGFGIQEDLIRLQYRFPSLQGISVESVVDLQLTWSSMRRDPLCYSTAWASPYAQGYQERLPRALAIRGLSGLVYLCCGVQLDKRAQCSDWEARPLSGEQIRYAALDARCLVDVFQVTKNW